MRYKKKIIIFTLIFVFGFTMGVMAGPQDKIEDMNFKNADLVDVLRAIAEVADVNLITDSNVSGTITVHLKDITFEKALALITQTRALDYQWDDVAIPYWKKVVEKAKSQSDTNQDKLDTGGNAGGGADMKEYTGEGGNVEMNQPTQNLFKRFNQRRAKRGKNPVTAKEFMSLVETNK